MRNFTHIPDLSSQHNFISDQDKYFEAKNQKEFDHRTFQRKQAIIKNSGLLEAFDLLIKDIKENGLPITHSSQDQVVQDRFDSNLEFRINSRKDQKGDIFEYAAFFL